MNEIHIVRGEDVIVYICKRIELWNTTFSTTYFSLIDATLDGYRLYRRVSNWHLFQVLNCTELLIFHLTTKVGNHKLRRRKPWNLQFRYVCEI